MALSGSVSVEATRSGRDMLVFSWEAVQDQKTMTSTVSWKMELVADEYGALDVTDAEIYPWAVTVDGQAFSGKSNICIGANETKTLAAGEALVAHEADGTKVFDFVFTQNFGGLVWGGSTELCQACSGTGLDANQSTGVNIPCSACNGNGIVGSSDGSTVINDVTGSGTGELDALTNKFPIRDFVNGLIMALCCSPIAPPKGEPVAFLYGRVAKEGETPTHTIDGVDYVGAVLQDIDDLWTDKETYPYAVILECNDFLYSEGLRYVMLMIGEVPFRIVKNKTGGTDIYGTYENGKYLFKKYYCMTYTTTGDTYKPWYGGNSGDPTGFELSDKMNRYTCWWTSHNLYNEDDTVYMSQSLEPIPIYE